MTVLVILCPTLRVFEHFVGFGGLFEILFGLLVPRILVGMEFYRQLTIRLLDFVFRGASFNTEDFLIITLCHILVFPALPKLASYLQFTPTPDSGAVNLLLRNGRTDLTSFQASSGIPWLSHKFVLDGVPHRLRWEFPSVFAAHEDVLRAHLGLMGQPLPS